MLKRILANLPLLLASVTIVVHTAEAVQFAPAKAFIEGLAAVKEKIGGNVHFIHASSQHYSLLACTDLFILDLRSQNFLGSCWYQSGNI